LSTDGCNTLTDNDLSRLLQQNSKSGCNVQDEQLGIFERVHITAMPESIEDRRRIRLEQHEQQHRERMQWYLESGDSILMAEAIAWLQVNGNGPAEP
jgi:hypothetical protein